MEKRLDRLRASMEREKLFAYVARSTTDIHWLTGFDDVFDEERAHTVCVTAGEASIHSDMRYSEALRDRARGTAWLIDDSRCSSSGYLADLLFNSASALHPSELPMRIGIEHDLPLNEFRALDNELKNASRARCPSETSKECNFSLVECSRMIFDLRAVKDENELARHRRAQEITDAAFTQVLGIMRPGMSEKYVAAELEFRMRSLGADGIAFPSIVASGAHTSIPHALPTDRLLAQGDLIVLDFGARYRGYCADMTRTVCMGTPSKEQRAMHAATLRAHESCKEAVAIGKTGSELHKLADEIIAAAGYAGCFTHSLGHGVGLDVHEMPVLAPRADQLLVCGNVITIEPGIYVPGVGGVRIEDFGVVTRNGFESFAQSSRTLIEL